MPEYHESRERSQFDVGDRVWWAYPHSDLIAGWSVVKVISPMVHPASFCTVWVEATGQEWSIARYDELHAKKP